MSGTAMRRIAVVYDCLYPHTTGGGERVYRAIAERLAERGAEVDYLTRRQRDAAAAPVAPFRIREIWEGEIAGPSGDRRPAAAIGFAAAVFRELRRTRGQYDIALVSALPPLNVFAARLALLGSKTWLVADWLEIWPFRKWREYSGPLVGSVAWLIQTVGLRLSDEVTVNSTFTLGRAPHLLRKRRGVVLGLVDLVGAPQVDRAATPVPGLILFAGRHIPDKQLPALPAALSAVHERHPEAHLVVVGSGPETPVLRAAAVEAGVDVDIRGRVSDSELETLMATAAVLVNPSRREGFGLVVAEAAAHGTPSVVVSGKDNAAVELVEEGVNGYVARSAEPADLADALIRAIDGGDALRRSTQRWFRAAAAERNLGSSLDELLVRYEAAAAD